MEIIKEIDLTKIDWNNLTPEEFQQFSEKIKENKENKERKKRTLLKNITVSLRNQFYELPSNLVERLQNMKSKQSKEKLIDEILVTYKPIEII